MRLSPTKPFKLSKPSTNRLLAFMLAFVLAFAGLPLAAIAEELETGAGEPVENELLLGDVASVSEADEDAASADDEAAQITTFVTIEVTDDDGIATPWLNATLKVAEGTDALTATLQALDAAGFSYELLYDDTFVYSITSPSGTTLAMADDYSVYWQFLTNGAYSSSGASYYTLVNGDSITWHFGAAGTPVNPAGPDYDTVTVPEEVEIEWAQFEDGGNVTDLATPTDAVEAWRTRVGGTSGASELVIADGSIFVAIGSSWDPTAELAKYAMYLVKIDAQSGEIVATTPLAGDIDYTCRPIVANGLVYIPLDGGAIQAVNAKTMKTYWVSSAAEDGGQATSTLAIHTVEVATGEYDENWNPVTAPSDLLFVGTAVYDYESGSYSKGSLRALDPFTGSVHDEWAYNNYSAGFYWTNTVVVGGRIVAADTAGVVHVLEAGSWGANELGTLALGSRVVSDLALYKGDVLVTTGDGTLWRIAVAEDGTPSVVSSVKAVSNCKSGPVVVGDTALVGGITDDESAAAVAVVDLQTMAVKQLITTADGEPLPTGWGNGVCAPVLVSVQEGKTICYFTINYGVNDPDDPTWTIYSEGGNAYWFELGESEAHLFYAPEGGEGGVAQYCDSPLIVDDSGDLYYLNDSGYIVKLVADAEPVDPEPVDPGKADPEQGGQGQQGGQNNQGGQPGGQNNQRGGQGTPKTGDESVSGAAAFALAAAMLGAAGLLRRKEN